VAERNLLDTDDTGEAPSPPGDAAAPGVSSGGEAVAVDGPRVDNQNGSVEEHRGSERHETVEWIGERT
jgi:hypothetical protein